MAIKQTQQASTPVKKTKQTTENKNKQKINNRFKLCHFLTLTPTLISLLYNIILIIIEDSAITQIDSTEQNKTKI